ncbi:MAG: hypothetical protein WC655_19750, partial [Candidatus Hydrogenedentales bacterium]
MFWWISWTTWTTWTKGAMDRTYRYYREAFAGRVMPFAFVDLDLFDGNVKDIAKRAGNRTIRIASKSVRSIPLLERILA